MQDLNKKDSFGSIWVWGIPALCLVLMGILLWNKTNIDVFFTINALSSFTGDKPWALLTFFGDGLFALVILAPWIRKKPQLVWAVLLATILHTLLGQSIKHLLQIPRPPKIIAPEHFHLIGPGWTTNSFPSGHSSMIFVLAGAFSLTTSRIWLRILLISAASLVALSRIVVGVHWPLDVLAGVALGWIVIWISLKLSPYMKWAWTNWRPKLIGFILLTACFLLFFIDYAKYENVIVEKKIIAIFFCVWGGIEYFKLMTKNNS